MERVEIEKGSEGGVIVGGEGSSIEEWRGVSLERESEAPVREERVGKREARLKGGNRSTPRGECMLDRGVEVG